ncbi:2,4-dienoyl-CoA reductase-like NADH-dependent reductase (Old Yellow Enzyme family) [Paraburkholderia tropica]|uniref:2,4-dienoyl-CoA reductase n=1 Tax=Paraburkholderia tropica TaxID=92647 RepID=A0AAQ1JTX5_9BURK|nr:alkene reductase [Paraburkholderia tropica]MBB3002317.1 2,4-dienoyl-CoA reductase-like NADH-dependent reductase (Old Yellow Enzyme family) [Paraburkholderia tropica]MBB6321705.1 2,4-dienoyl-CoA reductase-like NADH-dependent reductase (Old Yellow Enzyme family) [Paraburkholderia tropica]RQN38829.1 alkene reductase [Paraburkholderia tropica]SEJ60255.1 2,4-dienoyl-CoA reductase [Paraburkholderia tropica]
MTTLFDAYDLAGRPLRNRVVMAPMTRARAPGNVPNAATVRYYAQRASAGLIVTEGTPISPEGNGFVDCPGIWNDTQVAAWRDVTDAVHDLGGTIFTQIWHVGRMSHVSLQPGGAAPVSSTTAQAAKSSAFGYDEHGQPAFVTASKPHALSLDEIARVIEDFANAAQNAVDAGFDGVEIHGANGYLVEQFINGAVNDRTDAYGGDTVENRARFALAVVDACIARIGRERVGIRLSPFGRLHELGDFDGEADTFLYLARELGARGIAYVHIMDQASRGAPAMPAGFLERFRAAYRSETRGTSGATLILAGGLDFQKASALLASGTIDLAAFGAPYIANPDLVERFRHGWAIAKVDASTYYGGDAHGYTDYPHYTGDAAHDSVNEAAHDVTA